MRRILATTLLAAALLGVAACTEDSASTENPASLVDKKVTCDNYIANENATSEKIIKALDGLSETIGADAATKEAATAKFIATATAALASARISTEKEAAQAADPELKAQLTIYAAELAKLEETFGKVSPATELRHLPEVASAAGQAAAKKIQDLCG